MSKRLTVTLALSTLLIANDTTAGDFSNTPPTHKTKTLAASKEKLQKTAPSLTAEENGWWNDFK